MMIIVYIASVLAILNCVNAAASSKALEGYRSSFLKECPGSIKPAVISKKSLRFIEVYVSGTNAPAGQKRIKYNYHTWKYLANDTTMDWSKKTMFYLPGWMDHIYLPMGPMMRKLYQNMGYNVWILSDLRFVSQEYPLASRAIVSLGRLVGEMVADLAKHQPKFSPKRLELLGLSLGGHTMSFVAKSFYNITGVKISRMTAMDAAGPCFRNNDPEFRVDESDADFVDLILTNIDGLGMAAPVGHVNFYVNGGETQPGDLYWLLCGSFCSHARALPLYVASLLYPDSFIAIKCDSVQDARDRNCYDRQPLETNLLGPKVDRSKPGIYYLATKNTFPFFMGTDGLKKENDFVLKNLRKMNAIDDFTI